MSHGPRQPTVLVRVPALGGTVVQHVISPQFGDDFVPSLVWTTSPEMIDYCAGDSNVEVVDVLLQQRDRLLRELRINLKAAQDA